MSARNDVVVCAVEACGLLEDHAVHHPLSPEHTGHSFVPGRTIPAHRVEIAVEGSGHILQAAADAIAVRGACALGRHDYVWLIFNDLPIRVEALSTPESVADAYDQMRKDHHYGEHCDRR